MTEREITVYDEFCATSGNGLLLFNIIV